MKHRIEVTKNYIRVNERCFPRVRFLDAYREVAEIHVRYTSGFDAGRVTLYFETEQEAIAAFDLFWKQLA